MNLKERCQTKENYEKLLDKIAKDIATMDFSEVPVDDTYESCCSLAENLYGADMQEAYEIADIIEEKYIHLIE